MLHWDDVQSYVWNASKEAFDLGHKWHSLGVRCERCRHGIRYVHPFRLPDGQYAGLGVDCFALVFEAKDLTWNLGGHGAGGRLLTNAERDSVLMRSRAVLTALMERREAEARAKKEARRAAQAAEERKQREALACALRKQHMWEAKLRLFAAGWAVPELMRRCEVEKKRKEAQNRERREAEARLALQARVDNAQESAQEALPFL